MSEGWYRVQVAAWMLGALVELVVWNGKLRLEVYERFICMNFDCYCRPIAMSDPGRHVALFDGLPRDAGALAKIVQGLLIHQHIAPAYGVTL